MFFFDNTFPAALAYSFPKRFPKSFLRKVNKRMKANEEGSRKEILKSFL